MLYMSKRKTDQAMLDAVRAIHLRVGSDGTEESANYHDENCSTCSEGGSYDLPARWPCPTAAAVGAMQTPAP